MTEEQVRRAAGSRPFRFFESIGSTNTEALEWAQQGAPDGAIVVTAHQTQGRGRWGRDWSSEPGKLLQLSMILRPQLPLAELGLVTTCLGVACAEAIEAVCALRPSIKWPNDVRVNGSKVAGILVETHVTGAVLDVAVAGIGINVRWSRDEIPIELKDTATSLAAELEDQDDPAVEPGPLLAALLERFDHRYGALAAGAADLVAAAAARSDILGRDVVIALSTDETIEGRAAGLGPCGELQLDTGRGTRTVAVGEVLRLR